MFFISLCFCYQQNFIIVGLVDLRKQYNLTEQSYKESVFQVTVIEIISNLLGARVQH